MQKLHVDLNSQLFHFPADDFNLNCEEVHTPSLLPPHMLLGNCEPLSADSIECLLYNDCFSSVLSTNGKTAAKLGVLNSYCYILNEYSGSVKTTELLNLY